MAIGTYGDVTFEVSTDRVRTFDGFTRSGKARWAVHELAQEKPVLQYVGPEAEEIKFSMNFSASLGLTPRTEVEKLRAIRDKGEPQTLTIGGQGMGKWALESLDESHTRHDNRGNLLSASVNVSLKEYRERTDEPAYRQGLSGVTSLSDQAVNFGETVGEASKGVTTVPAEAVSEVTSTAEETGGGWRGKLSTAATNLRDGASTVSQGLNTLSLTSAAVAELASKSPAEAVATVLDRASNVSSGVASQALKQTLGTEMAEAGEKYLGRAKDVIDTARYARLAWLEGVSPTSALDDVSTVRRAATVTGKISKAAGKAADVARLNV